MTVTCCSCGEVENTSADSEQLTYYYTEQYMDQMVEIIKRYNRWCSSHSTEDMKIKLIEWRFVNCCLRGWKNLQILVVDMDDLRMNT